MHEEGSDMGKVRLTRGIKSKVRLKDDSNGTHPRLLFFFKIVFSINLNF